MRSKQEKAFAILNWSEAAASAVIVATYFILVQTQALGAGELLGTSILTTSLGLIHIGYVVLLHPFLKKRSLVASSFVCTGLFSINVAALIINTGGFTSPYYALWLLIVLLVGLYRPSVTYAFMAVTTLYAASLFLTHTETGAISNIIIPIITTYIAGGLGILLWGSHHSRHSETENLSSAQSQLSQEQLKSEIVIRNIGDGVVVVDTNMRIQLFNPSAQELTGWSESEAKGLDYHVVMPLAGEDGNPLTADNDLLTKSFDKKQSIVRDDVTLTSRSNKKLTLSIMVSPIFDATQKASGGIIVFRDISSAKAAERQRDEFISTASHEMRTPVAAIEGYVALAINPKVATIDDKARQYLTKAQESAQHLGKLFQDLLSTTKLEEGKLPNRPEVFDMTELVHSVVDELHFKAEKKQVALVAQQSAVSGGTTVQPILYVLADPERIQEVLTNLVDNALKFTEKGEVKISIEGNDKTITVGVHDSGIGIAPEDLPHIFQKFYRIDNSKTRTIGGTGLGLYICRQIIELYQGRMWVESKPEEGSHFYFSLPRLSFEQAEAKIKAKAAAQAGTTNQPIGAKTQPTVK